MTLKAHCPQDGFESYNDVLVEHPLIDQVAIDRAMRGDREVHENLTRAERRELHRRIHDRRQAEVDWYAEWRDIINTPNTGGGPGHGRGEDGRGYRDWLRLAAEGADLTAEAMMSRVRDWSRKAARRAEG